MRDGHGRDERTDESSAPPIIMPGRARPWYREPAYANPIGPLTLLTAATFASDLLLPTHLSVLPMYVFLVMVALLARSRRVVLGYAGVATALIITGAFIPWDAERLWREVAERSLGVVVLWVVATLGWERAAALFQIEAGQERERQLVNELDHRVRNNLSSLLSLIRVQRDRGVTGTELVSSLEDHVRGMLSSYSVLSRRRWGFVSVDDLVHAVMSEAQLERTEQQGGPLVVSPRQATSVAMLIQQLSSASVMRGALGTANGRVKMSWDRRTTTLAGQDRVTLSWEELAPPTAEWKLLSEFERVLIESTVAHDLNGTCLIDERPGLRRFVFDLMLETDAPSVKGPDPSIVRGLVDAGT